MNSYEIDQPSERRHSPRREDWGIKVVGKILAFLAVSIAPVRRYVELVAHLRKLATRDLLTGLFNRSGMLLSLEAEVSLLIRQKNRVEVWMALIDLDSFKLANDTLGHLGGDTILKIVANHIKQAFRGSDILIRWGGDEFAVILLDVDRAVAIRRAQAFLSRLRQDDRLSFTTKAMKPAQVTASIGLVSQTVNQSPQGFSPDIQGLCQQLTEKADPAMYQAKLAGKNQVCLYSDRPKVIPLSRQR